ncbi:putative C6 zinc finger protein [Seiridium unicorne]|uniref:C6 zinc finger protein n=1 Tax=Seiridium unicorne TaxID=138068 RepID=A0ABR2USI2_9PEZI
MDPLELTQAMPPMMNYIGNSLKFGYAAFLQDQEVNYLTEERSSNSNSAFTVGPLSNNSPPDATSSSKKSGNQKQRLERRGHTKSRRGCYNCKRRRIKCQETRPSCGHCSKTGLQCEYSAVPQVAHQPQHQIPLFSLQDMRFFQHFLQVCFPRYPLGNESIWTHEIPCLSHKYEYLMHAILGLSASELMVKEPGLVTFAMAHRLKAIKAIKKTLAEVPKSNTFEEGNALMATCFALTFQSAMLDDGMAEYMTFIRGIIITAIQMWGKGAKFLFHDFVGEDQMALLKPLMEHLPVIKKEWTDMAVAGIRALQPLCKHPVEVEYYGFILDIAETLYTSPFAAYQILRKHYGWWMQISHENFAHLIDPENATCALLASHWIALKQIMATITEKEYEARAQTPAQEEKRMDLGMIRWLKHLNRQVSPEYQRFNQRPVWVEAQLDVDLTFFW